MMRWPFTHNGRKAFFIMLCHNLSHASPRIGARWPQDWDEVTGEVWVHYGSLEVFAWGNRT